MHFLFALHPRLEAEETGNLRTPKGTDNNASQKPALLSQTSRKRAAQQDRKLLQSNTTEKL